MHTKQSLRFDPIGSKSCPAIVVGLTLRAFWRSEFPRTLLNVELEAALEVVLNVALEVVLEVVLDVLVVFVVFVCDFVSMQSVAFAVTVTVRADWIFDDGVVVLVSVVVGASEASTMYTAVEHSGHR